MANTILVIPSAQNGSRTAADGTQPVDSQIETLTAALKAIRDRADAALKQIEQSAIERRSLSWNVLAVGALRVSRDLFRPKSQRLARNVTASHSSCAERLAISADLSNPRQRAASDSKFYRLSAAHNHGSCTSDY
jgi:hypothetical protein